MKDYEPSWALIVEDDKLFVVLFGRFWKEAYPQVELVAARSLREARLRLGERRVEPAVAVLDLNLEDGSGATLQASLSCPTLLWSASPEGGFRAKPRGRDELAGAVAEIGRIGGLDTAQ